MNWVAAEGSMPNSSSNQRFFASTRGQVVALLRRASRTVEELARALDLTDNAVRAHLATLERDGLVKQEGVRRGAGKPAYAYNLTQEGEQLFPKVYDLLLVQMLDVLAERTSPEALEDVLREVGRRLAREQPVADGNLRGRVERAVELLAALGGLAEVEEQDDRFLIHGYSCPLAAVVPGHPGVCGLAESLLQEVVGAPVRERCEKGDRPRCCFEVLRAEADGRSPSTTSSKLGST
jgi:predicted ArsR family transcriptional regulator